MNIDDFKRMRAVGQRKLQGEANLRDMTEVTVQELEDGSTRFELDEKNRRFRALRDGEVGPWQELERGG